MRGKWGAGYRQLQLCLLRCGVQARHDASAGGVASNIDTETHKTGLEPVSDRARNLTDVAQVQLVLCLAWQRLFPGRGRFEACPFWLVVCGHMYIH